MSTPPPEGTPEYDAWAAEDNGPWVLITCWVVTAVSTLFIVGRVYVRGFIHGKLQQDDYWSILAQICGYISVGLSTAAVASGNGKHFALLSVEQQQNAILYTTAAFCPGVMSFGLPKLAVVYLLTKLLNPGKWHKAFLWWMAIWCQLTLFATVGVLIGRCRPARSLWTFDIEGECFDNNILVAYCIYAGAFSSFVDLYLAVYPAVVLFNLQLTFKKKVALSIALGIGSVSGVVAIYKTTRIPALGSLDFSYDTSDLVVWTVIEGSTIMIASAIPVLQPLLEKILKRNPFSSGRSTGNRKYGERDYEDITDQNRSVVYELGERKQRPKPKDDLGMTILNDDSSQEEILATNKTSSVGQAYSQPGVQGAGKNKIVRTHEVTVTYDDGQDPSRMPNGRVPEPWSPTLKDP